MPRGDGTGPFGQGPGTGRGMGRDRSRGMAGWVELVRELDPLANASVQPVEQEPLIRQGSLALL